MEGSPAWNSLWQALQTIYIKRTGEPCIQGAGIVDGSGRKIASFGCMWEHETDFHQDQLRSWVDFLQPLRHRTNNYDGTVIANLSKSLHRHRDYNVEESCSRKSDEPSNEKDVLTRWLAQSDMPDLSNIDTTRNSRDDDIGYEEDQTLFLASAKYCPITSRMDSNRMIAQSLGQAESQLVLFRRMPHMRSVGDGLFIVVLSSKARAIAIGGQGKQCSGNIASVISEQVDEWLRLNSF